MNRFTAMAAIPLFAGFLYGQETRTWNGVLVDAGCRTTHTERTESTTGNHQTTTTTRTTQSVDCPVTTTTTSFGLLTPEGRYIPFDQTSNTRVVEVVRNHPWERDKPMNVRVMGNANGDVLMVDSISPAAMEGESSRLVGTTVERETMFDARYNGDDGKLVMGPDRITWQDLSHTDRSHTWNYSDIKELKRDKGDNAVKIEGYRGGEHKFKIRGPYMNDEVYNMIAERIVAARPH